MANDTTATMTKLEKIQAAIAKFPSFSAEQDSADLIVVRNKKGQISAKITGEKVEQVKAGRQNLCGALVRNAIAAAIQGAK